MDSSAVHQLLDQGRKRAVPLVREIVNNFQLIAQNLDVNGVLHAIQRKPDLWNRRKLRTTFPGTPHGEVSDIWIRFSEENLPIEEMGRDMNPIWYSEWNELPQLRPLVFGLMQRVEAYELGRVFITKLPPGGKILPHADVLGDYAQLEDAARYHVVLQGLPGSLYRCGGETVNMLTGQCWWFNHLAEHEVVNNSADDRIHLLIDTRNA
jgi:hypothetical protein